MRGLSSLNLCASFLVKHESDSFSFINKPMLSLLAIEPKTILFLLNKIKNKDKQKLNLYSRKLNLYVFLRKDDENTFVIITPYPRLLLFLEALRSNTSLFLERGFLHVSIEISFDSNHFLLADYVLSHFLLNKRLVSGILDDIYGDIYNDKIKYRELLLNEELKKKIAIILSLLEREFIPSPFFVFSKNNLSHIREYISKTFNIDSEHVILIEDLNKKHIENLLKIFYECNKSKKVRDLCVIVK